MVFTERGSAAVSRVGCSRVRARASQGTAHRRAATRGSRPVVQSYAKVRERGRGRERLRKREVCERKKERQSEGERERERKREKAASAVRELP